ncbi:hypothetical protein BH09BAC5_BH09BAC5_00810 [soil metagenome]
MVTANYYAFFICIFLCSVLIVYPFIIFFFRIRRKPANHFPIFIAPVSIIIVCFNEDQFIRDKILSFLDPEEWIEGSELIIVSGGSTDGTNAILKEFQEHKYIRLHIFEKRVAKIAGINFAATQRKNDLLVFSDCRQKMKKGSVKNIISPFSNPEIGTVSSTLTDSDQNSNTSFIRGLMNRIAFAQSESGSSLNLFGALYAQRKSVFRTIPDDILFDDLFVTVSTIVQGKRLIQSKEAIIRDIHFEHYYTKERIERLTRGLLVFLFKHKKLILQLPLGTMLCFFIYKYLKLLFPFLVCLILISGLFMLFPVMNLNFLILTGTFFLILFAFKDFRKFFRLLFRIQYYIMTATFRFLFLNKRSITWQKLEGKNIQNKL